MERSHGGESSHWKAKTAAVALAVGSVMPGAVGHEVRAAEGKVASVGVEAAGNVVGDAAQEIVDSYNSDGTPNAGASAETPTTTEAAPIPKAPENTGNALPGLNHAQIEIIQSNPYLTPAKREFLGNITVGAMAIKNEGAPIPTPVMMAQAICEAGWGEHANGNNLFGIKADSTWHGPTVLINTSEWDSVNKRYYPVKAAFRAYPSYKESFEDYVHFIKSNWFYDDAVKGHEDPMYYLRHLEDSDEVRNTPRGPQKELAYATSPTYVATITNIMKNNHLEELISVGDNKSK